MRKFSHVKHYGIFLLLLLELLSAKVVAAEDSGDLQVFVYAIQPFDFDNPTACVLYANKNKNDTLTLTLPTEKEMSSFRGLEIEIDGKRTDFILADKDKIACSGKIYLKPLECYSINVPIAKICKISKNWSKMEIKPTEFYDYIPSIKGSLIIEKAKKESGAEQLFPTTTSIKPILPFDYNDPHLTISYCNQADCKYDLLLPAEDKLQMLFFRGLAAFVNNNEADYRYQLSVAFEPYFGRQERMPPNAIVNLTVALSDIYNIPANWQKIDIKTGDELNHVITTTMTIERIFVPAVRKGRMLEVCAFDEIMETKSTILLYRIKNISNEQYKEYGTYGEIVSPYNWFSIHDEETILQIDSYYGANRDQITLAPNESATIAIKFPSYNFSHKANRGTKNDYIVKTNPLISDFTRPSLPILITKQSFKISIVDEVDETENLGLKQIVNENDVFNALSIISSNTLSPRDKLTLLAMAVEYGKIDAIWLLIFKCDEPYAVMTILDELPANLIDKNKLFELMLLTKDISVRKKAIMNFAKTGQDEVFAKKIEEFMLTQQDEVTLTLGEKTVRALKGEK